MNKRIAYTHEFPVWSDSGGKRVIVCLEDSAKTGDSVESPTHYVPTVPATYQFEGGEPAAKIGDLFLDCSGEIYRRIT
jgi:hypothetical protein